MSDEEHNKLEKRKTFLNTELKYSSIYASEVSKHISEEIIRNGVSDKLCEEIQQIFNERNELASDFVSLEKRLLEFQDSTKKTLAQITRRKNKKVKTT